MSYSKWKIKVPGKLMIAGEYAVIEPNQHAVVIAIDRYITANIERNNKNVLSLPQLGLDLVTWRNEGNQVVFDSVDPRLTFIQHAIKVINQLLQERGIFPYSYHLTIRSNLDDPSGRKYGLGSSAAIVVATVASILSLHRVRLSSEQVFKLSSIAHLKAQGNGSCADIAASAFGGWIYYSSFHSNWIMNELQQEVNISGLIEVPWPGLTISSLIPPSNFKLCVGWTVEVARTGPMVNKIQELRVHHPNLYKQFLEESSLAVHRLIKSFESGDCIGSMASISQNRQALRKLEEYAGIPIETLKLKALCDVAEIYGSGKSSGAGGGDCGIAFVSEDSQVVQLHQAWKKEGIHPLHLQVSQNGVIVTEQDKNNKT